MRSCSSCREVSARDCASLKKRLRAVDFAIVETTLYLDAYPTSRQALDYYHKLMAERALLLEATEKHCGPVTARGNVSTTEWDWVKGPWPWQPEAN